MAAEVAAGVAEAAAAAKKEKAKSKFYFFTVVFNSDNVSVIISNEVSKSPLTNFVGALVNSVLLLFLFFVIFNPIISSLFFSRMLDSFSSSSDVEALKSAKLFFREAEDMCCLISTKLDSTY